MNERLKGLYKTIILEHNKEPFFFEKNEKATYGLKAYNQICGDRFELYFDVKNGLISDLTFHGFGCAISKASTSVLVKNLRGKDFIADGIGDASARIIINKNGKKISSENIVKLIYLVQTE